MNLSDKQLEEVKDLASLAFSPDEIAEIMEIEDDNIECFVDACKMPGNNIRKNFRAGLLTLTAELRKSIKTSAVQGSNPAQQMMIKFIDHTINKLENA